MARFRCAAPLRRPHGRGSRSASRWVVAVILAAPLPCWPAAAAGATPPRAAVSDQPAPGIARVALQVQQFDGFPIARFFYDLYGGTGSEESDRELRRSIEAATQPIAGAPFNAILTDRVLSAIRALDGVQDASYALYASDSPGAVVLVLNATLGADGETPARGVLATGRRGDFPILAEDERRLLRVQLNGGHGLYSDHNPWFASPATYTSRSPIALDPPGAGRTTWAESWIEYGFAGANRIGDSFAYAYGELTGLTSAATGHDLFRSDTRSKTLFEKAYAGVLWADAGAPRAARVSAGRQNWQLNNGFLFSKFAAGANAGPNPGLYLSPRTTYEMAILAEARHGRFRIEYFDVDPAELRDFDSGTRFRGMHLSWLDQEAWDLGAAAYEVPESNTVFRTPQGSVLPREGQRTWNLRAGHKAVAGIEGLSALAEFAQQDHPDFDVRAQAWYAQFGYTAAGLPWKPSFTYRYASFSGDDPGTDRWEAFDAPLSSGLDEWVQGVDFKKVVANTNLDTHRLRLNLAPDGQRNYTIDWFRLEADVPLATGESVYGEELDLAIRWAVSKRLYFLGVAGVAWPGAVIEAQTGGAARPWATVQASLFWGL